MKLIDLIDVRNGSPLSVSGFPRSRDIDQFITLNCNRLVAKATLRTDLLNAEIDYIEARSDENGPFIKAHLKDIDESLTTAFKKG